MVHHQVLRDCLLRNQGYEDTSYRTDPVQEEMTVTLAFGVSNLANFCLKINSPTVSLQLCVGLRLKGKET
ncbi:unnamed protein product [Brassica rapa]|uniref:Uncharacterized protein n=1 Tax=Brassica campestris TaxID=3711 RepID=A0A8D9DTP2_BRACM|nr:unnamed protein product [Brassica rapa]